MPIREKGFIHLPVLVIVFGLLFASAIIPVSRSFNDGKSGNVAGVTTDQDVKISSDSGQTAVVNKRTGALSSFPLSVNKVTGELTVTTPSGSKVVTVLPQAAIDNMLAAKVMTDVISEKVTSSLASIPNLIKLEIKNNILGYKIKGSKTHKLFGFIPIKSDVEAFVSAENGKVVESSTSFLGRILNRIAP